MRRHSEFYDSVDNTNHISIINELIAQEDPSFYDGFLSQRCIVKKDGRSSVLWAGTRFDLYPIPPLSEGRYLIAKFLENVCALLKLFNRTVVGTIICSRD